MKRNIHVDISKGIGILLVVIGHLDFPAAIHDSIYLFHMPLFFIIAGLFTDNNSEYKSIVIRKTNRLLVPLIPYLPLLILIYCITSYYKDSTFPPVITFFSISSIDVPLWFVPVLFSVHIVFASLNLIANKLYRIALMIVISVLGYMLIANQYNLPLYITKTAFCFSFFMMGYMLKRANILGLNCRNYIVQSKWRGGYVLLTLMCCYILFSFTTIGVRMDIVRLEVPENPILLILPIFVGTTMVFSIAKLLDKTTAGSLFAFLGRNSYPIMVFHWPFIKLLRMVPFEESMFVETTYVAVLIAISLLCGKLYNIVFPKICPNIQ